MYFVKWKIIRRTSWSCPIYDDFNQFEIMLESIDSGKMYLSDRTFDSDKISLYGRNRLKRYREFLSNSTRIICRFFITEGMRYSKFKVISTEFPRQLTLDTKRNTWEGSFVKKSLYICSTRRDSRAYMKQIHETMIQNTSRSVFMCFLIIIFS